MSDRITEIENRLNAATPGPWEEFWHGHIHARDERGTVSICQTFGPEDQIHHDAEFIAHSPSDVAYLLAELRKRDEALERVERLAIGWHLRGESDMAFSKTLPDEDIAMAILTEGATKVENARHIRNALKGDGA